MSERNPGLWQRIRQGGRPAPVVEDPALAIMSEVIAGQHVQMVYQPVVDLATGEIFAYEALARPQHKILGGPEQLFTIAIAQGRCGELGRRMRQLAVEGCRNTPLLINIVPHEFDEGWLVRTDDALFWNEEQIYIEITESFPLSQFAYYKGILHEIRTKGIKLAVDDLGAGYSNLKYVAELAPDIVKVDRDLVAGVDKSRRQQQLVQSVVQLCSSLGAKVVAEGIETEGELQASIDAGAHYGQGYLLARPAMPPPPVLWPIAERKPSP